MGRSSICSLKKKKMGDRREGVRHQSEDEAYGDLTEALWGEKRQNQRPQMSSPAQPTLPHGI